MDKEEQKKSHLIIHWKRWLLVIVIGGGIVVGFGLWVWNLYTENQIAELIIDTRDTVIEELDRCEEFLALPGGEFDTYDYCKEFVEKFSTLR
ncbi:hypothetical protein ACFL0L_01560 [Patescibacteria group bacterium]